MTLDELLALLPDNTTGEISAADMRTIVIELHKLASVVGQVFSYVWVTSGGSPGAGKVTMDQPWQTLASKALISETTDDGQVLTFAGLDNALEGQLWFATQDGAKLRAKVLGPSVDQGGYREVPIQVTEMSGTPPSNNEKMSLTFVEVAG